MIAHQSRGRIGGFNGSPIAANLQPSPTDGPIDRRTTRKCGSSPVFLPFLVRLSQVRYGNPVAAPFGHVLARRTDQYDRARFGFVKLHQDPRSGPHRPGVAPDAQRLAAMRAGGAGALAHDSVLSSKYAVVTTDTRYLRPHPHTFSSSLSGTYETSAPHSHRMTTRSPKF
jgi:hypothetical protein